MPSTAIDTLVKMMETLSGPVQDQIVEHLRDYIAEIQDERQWNGAFPALSEGVGGCCPSSETRGRCGKGRGHGRLSSMKSARFPNKGEEIWSVRITMLEW